MKVLTFGEIMLRLKAPGHERLMQTPNLEATFGGGEANVAVSLANYGMDVSFLSFLPNNAVADACIGELRRFNVDTSRIIRKDGRVGIYYLDAGANQLPSKVIYDRAYSSISLAGPGDVDWNKAFDGVGWMHISGITPAISESLMELSIESVKEAKTRNIVVSCDLNYRKNLWKYGKNAQEVMSEMASFCDVLIANEEDVQKSLGITIDVDVESSEIDNSKYDNYALVTIGTGVGCGIIINGKIYETKNGFNGELGHMVIKKGGILCNCGRRGCFEKYASITRLLSMTKCRSLGELFDRLETSPRLAEIFDTYLDDLAEGLANFITICDVDMLVIGGSIAWFGDRFYYILRGKIADKLFARESKDIKLKFAKLGNDAGLIGSAFLADL